MPLGPTAAVLATQAQLAHSLTGHWTISAAAADSVVAAFPPSMHRFRHILRRVKESVVMRDVTDVVTCAHWRDAGQKHHFMRYKGQTVEQAYEAGYTWIRDRARRGALNLCRLRETASRRHFAAVAGPLGDALHALQDSFAPAHTNRVKVARKLMIADIYVYDDHNKTARDGWAGHSALDEAWRADSSSNELSAVGHAAYVASIALLRCAAYAALAPSNSFAAEWQAYWPVFWKEHLLLR